MSWVEVPFEVQRPQEGLRVDQYLSKRLHRYSRAEVQRLIASGQVFLRNRTAKASSRVAAGETVLIRYPKHTEAPCAHSALAVLYEDEHLLAVDKPGNVLSHPTDKIVENSATSILKKQFPGQKLYLAHRLDRETSGILLFAKSAESARILAGQFERREVRKEYWALVRGQVPWAQKIVDAPLGREGLEIKVRQAIGGSQSAVTEFERLKIGPGFSLVAARPKTGRLHQIRVHLAWLGHPILGDKLYTGEGELYMKTVRREITAEDLESLGAPRQLLHAARLSLNHPITGAGILISSPIPKDFQLILRQAGI